MLVRLIDGKASDVQRLFAPILETYAEGATFFLPESAYLEAEEHLADLISERGADPAKGLSMLRATISLVDLVSPDVYGLYEAEARRRIATRDADDFVGCGVATWTSNRVAIFLSDQADT